MKNLYILSICLVMLIAGCADSNDTFDDLSINIGSDIEVSITEVAGTGADEVIINEEAGKITLVYPCDTDVKDISPAFSVSEGASVDPGSGTSLDLSSPKQLTVINGNLFKKYTISADIRCVTAFLSYASTVETIVDDDEIAAAAWFFDSFDETVTKFVSFDDIKADPTVLDDVTTLFWVLDGHPEDNSNWFPEIALDTDVLGTITTWYKNGGNIYLHQQAAHYIFDLGRMTQVSGFPEKMIGGGTGFENGDTWSVGINIGLTHDNSTHPMFNGIDILTYDNGQKAIPTIGPGWREDRNAMQNAIPGRYGLPNTDEEAYTRYTTENNLVWIGSWDGIVDYYNGGIFEYLPTDEYKGRAISIGIGGVEWNMNADGERGASATINPEGENLYQDNVETMAFNIINYLSTN